MDGSLEDAMYGLYDGDEASWSLQTALTNDRLADSRILTTIHSPTHDKPFRFLGVKWFETAIPSVISAFARKRDTLVLEAMGLTTDEFGDSYGYYVLNDYQHPSIPELSDIGIIRSKLSICYIFRQASFGRVSIYARVSVDVGGGDLMRRVGVILAAESIALTAKAIDTAHAKKLHWLVQHHQVQRSDGSSDPSLSPSSSMDCESCQKTTGCSLLSPRLTTCHACRGSFCSRCTVERNLVDVDAGVQVISHVFCFGCVFSGELAISHECILSSRFFSCNPCKCKRIDHHVTMTGI